MMFFNSKPQNLLAFCILFFGSNCLFSTLSTTNDVAYASSKITPTKIIQILNQKINTKNICPSSKFRPIRTFNTTKYYLYICPGDKKNPDGYYVRIPKSGGKFVVPLSKIKDNNYIAIKGEAIYVVNPYESLVSKRGRIILRERVKSATNTMGRLVAKACNLQDKIFAQAETKSFIIYVCGQDSPSRYVVIARSTSERIELSLKSNLSGVKSDVHRYLATRGNIRYVLTKKILRISHHGKTILKEKVLRWY
ncbi:MAG: hypothetical protein AAF378_13730 [Cyanobacteria bacterium P01_A01_bin.84]